MRVFLLTSFPSLAVDAPAPLGVAEVLSRCADLLPEADLQALEDLCSHPSGGDSTFARDWRQVWEILQAWNRRERRSRLSLSAEEAPVASVIQPNSQLRGDLEQAWAESDPLKRETALLQAEWNWLEAKRRASPYSMEDLFGYVLQLQLLERKDRWEEEAGAAQFQAHVRSFLDPVLEQLQETNV